MHRSYFDNTPYHLLPHKAQSYYRSKAGLVPARPETNTGITVSNGGWNASLGDVLKYVGFLLGDATRPDYDIVLKRVSLEEMLDARSSGGLKRDAERETGLLFLISRRRGRTLISHSGSQNAFITLLELDVKARSAFVIAFNTSVAQENEGEPGATSLIIAATREVLLDRVFPTLGRRSGQLD